MTSTIISAAGASVAPHVILSMMWIAIAALLAPLLSHLTGKRIPGVVFMLVLGVIIGPAGLGWASSDASNALLRELGLGMLFLLAGWEIDPDTIRGKQGRAATITWMVSLGLAFGAAIVLFGSDGEMLRAVVVAIAVSSTAMGTLLPVIKMAGRDGTPVGKGVLVHGAVGELGPVFAMALLLSSRATRTTLLILIIFMGVALIVAFLPRTVSKLVPWVGRAVIENASHTSQTVMRGVIVLLTTLMAMAAVFELDVVLGAFAAGIILRALVPPRNRKTIEARLDVMGYGLLIPIFFITSGMAIELEEVLSRPWLVLGGIGVILLARGLPIFLVERFTHTKSGIRGLRDQLELSLYSATGLPIIVAVTEIAIARGLLTDAQASILVSSGVGTVLIFPLLAAAAHTYLPEPPDMECPDEKARVEEAAHDEAREYREEKVKKKSPKPAASAATQEKKPKPKSTTVEEHEITLDDHHECE